MAAERIIDAGWGMAAVERPASDPTILWIHGYAMDGRVWADLLDRLPRWRHLMLDLPGHGRSVPLQAGLDLPELGRRVGTFAAREGAAHLVGLSFGGMVALQAAIERPAMFETMTLGAPALAGGPQDRHAQARNIALRALYRSRGAGPWLRDLWMTSPPDIFKGAERQPALWARLAAIVADHSWAELADDRMQGLTMYAQSPADLGRIRADTLVLIGSDDADAFKRSAELIRRSVPHCRRLHLEGTGHLTLLERAEDMPAVLIDHVAHAGRSHPRRSIA